MAKGIKTNFLRDEVLRSQAKNKALKKKTGEHKIISASAMDRIMKEEMAPKQAAKNRSMVGRAKRIK